MKNTDIQKITFPHQPWIYIFQDAKKNILYIGKAKNLHQRIQQYFTPNSVRKQDMVNKASNIDFITVQNETEALQLEDNLIKQHKPPFNHLLKWNNRYVYLKITNEDFPQFFFVKQRKNDKATYVGPKHHSKELKKLLQYCRILFKYRSCKNTQFRQSKLCSDYYFWLCKGRCQYGHNSSYPPNWKNKSEISTNLPKSQYKNITKSIKKFFEWNTKPISKTIHNEIQNAIKQKHFERAAKLRDILIHIKQISEKQRVILDPKLNGYIFHIHHISERFVYQILHFFEWKLIDIIHHKQASEDTDFANILASIQSEFGEMKITNQEKNIQNGHSIKLKINKKKSIQIQSLSQDLLDNYLAKTSFQKENIISNLLSIIQKRYKLPKFPYHIECADISHFSGDRTSGWLSCFIGGIPNKKYYRKYKISTSTKHKHNSKYGHDSSCPFPSRWNDLDSLHELITRRFKPIQKSKNQKAPSIDKGRVREGFVFPDLFILDGGKPQLNIIKKLRRQTQKNPKELDIWNEILKNTTFIALGKGKARKRAGKQTGIKEKIYYFEPNVSWTITSKILCYDQADRIILQLRDEAHRFANTYRKTQMSKDRK